jgi:hypothetical protein
MATAAAQLGPRKECRSLAFAGSGAASPAHGQPDLLASAGDGNRARSPVYPCCRIAVLTKEIADPRPAWSGAVAANVFVATSRALRYNSSTDGLTTYSRRRPGEILPGQGDGRAGTRAS